ncbi:MAG: signal peptide peptidase SppA [FCB group bacterium]|nr:signal peptide peptidase SppA [FCB group bacterium]
MRYTLTTGILILTLAFSITAQDNFTIPNYYDQSGFLGTTPGVSGDASGAFFNPAIYGMMKTSEVGFYWTDFDRQPGTLDNYSLHFAVPNLGYSFQTWEADAEIAPGQYQDMSFTDHTLGIGFGDRNASFGLGYSWSKGDIPPEYERSNVFSAGFLTRPCRHASIGLAGHFNNAGQKRAIADFGLRPFGSRFLTLFADAALMDYQPVKDIEWSAGLSLQPLPGIDLFGKFYRGGIQDQTIMAGIAYTIGGSKESYLSHYDKNSKQTYSTYSISLRSRPSEDIITDRIMKDKMYLNLKMDSGVKYQRYLLFDDGGYTLTEILNTIEDAKNDPKIYGITMYITEDMWGSYELIWEVREKLKEFKAAGKKIYAFFERGGMKQYYLASVADEIMIDPESLSLMLGFNLGRTYYKNALDKAGIGFDEWRFFEFKSANEPFSRTSMSEGDRQQRNDLAQGWYDTYRADVCESRGFSTAEFDRIVDEVGILTSDAIIENNLADTTGRWDEFKEWLKELDGKKKPMICSDKLEMLQTIDEEWGTPPQIAVIYAIGLCDMNTGINANKLKHVIKKAREDKNIKAVVFRADSPGGDILPSDIVAVELKKTAEEKPVIVTQGWVAASGGYYISIYGDKIVASPWTITGSIGVIGGWPYNDGIGEKIGFTYDHTQAGKHADLGGGINIPLLGSIPDRNLTTEERALVEKLIVGAYEDFVQKSADGRNMTYEELEPLAQGRVYTGTSGKEIGLIDELGGLEKAVDMALEAAEIDKDGRWEIVEMPDKGLFDASMFTPKLLGLQGPIYEMLTTEDPEIQYFRLLTKSQGRPMVMAPPELWEDLE